VAIDTPRARERRVSSFDAQRTGAAPGTEEACAVADSEGFSEALKKQQYGLFVVGSKSSDGESNGMTANWASQVSFDPQIFAVAVQAGAHTRKNIDETGVFSISILGEGTKDLSLKFTAQSKSGEGRLENEPVSYYETGSPVLDAAVGWFECRVIEKAEPGDHVVFFGQVIGGDAGTGDATTLAATGMSYAG
jgi:flavin reductase (DIM6/NTAB) family NADH-FMN oxidoreductase RutF